MVQFRQQLPGVYVGEIADTCKMEIIDRASNITGIMKAVLNRGPDIGIPGSFAESNVACFLTVPVLVPGTAAACASAWKNNVTGYVVKSGKRVLGKTEPKTAYLIYSKSGLKIGIGDTPENDPISKDRVLYGIGGLIPVIIAGVEYSDQKSPWYKLHNRFCGRCIVGHNKTRRKLYIIAQEQRGLVGRSLVGLQAHYCLDHLRQVAKLLGCENAVGVDGSTSTFLTTKNRAIIKNDQGLQSGMNYKDLYNGNAIGFFV